MKHGCNGLPRPTPDSFYLAQDGYNEPWQDPVSGAWFRTPKYKQIFHVMSTDCGYIESKNDSGCDGCHQKRK